MKKQIITIYGLFLVYSIIYIPYLSAQVNHGVPLTIGLRGGRGSEGSGISVTVPIGKSNRYFGHDVELIFGKRYPTKMVGTILFKRNVELLKLKNTALIYGLGFHIIQRHNLKKREGEIGRQMDKVYNGIDFLFGYSYRIQDLPFILVFDLKPHFDLDSYQTRFFDFAFTFWYIIKK